MEALGNQGKQANGKCCGTVKATLRECRSGEATVTALEEMYRTALPAETITKAMAYAIEQPPEVEVNEIVVRPAVQAF